VANFNILDHLDRLILDGGSQGKNEHSYQCPVCGSSNFKVTIAGPNSGKYQTYGCSCMESPTGKQSIIDAISPRWEKPVRAKSSQTFTYETLNDTTPVPLAQVRRTDDGQGKRKFSQWHKADSKWVSGFPEELGKDVHLYKIFDKINQKVIANGELVLVVEGEGVVDDLHKLGIAATCSIGGGGKWTDYGYPNYLKDLEGSVVVICPDRDKPGIKHAEAIANDFPDAPWLYADPTSFMWDRIPENKGYDLGDWIADGATRETILGAIEPRRIPKVKQTTSIENVDLTAVSGREVNSKILRKLKAISQAVGTELKLNELRNCLEFRGRPLDPNTYRLFVAHLIDQDVSHDDCTMILGEIGKKNAYHPVKNWLEALNEQYGNSTIELLNTVSTQYLHTSNPLYDRYMLCQMVAAVARVYQPGCKSDHSVIIQGGQNLFKSTFWNVLAGDDWFDDNLGSDVENKDELLKLHRTWFEEWGEIDRITTKKELGVVKSFLSRKIDTFRAPYERTSVEHPRRGVIVGTVNPTEFLRDEEDRRLWIIPITQKIDIEGVRRDRELLWAAAVALYKGETKWWLTSEEEELQRESNKQFAVRDVWEEGIESWVSESSNQHTDRGYVRVQDILSDCLEIKEAARQENLHKVRVQGILKRLGWTAEKDPVRIPGFKSVQRVWSKKLTPSAPTPPPTVTSPPPTVTSLSAPTPPPTVTSPPTGDWDIEDETFEFEFDADTESVTPIDRP
jgi:predicted P-loop ATPase